jgi:aspartate carbamoyltransferase catalytic subunit
LDHFIESQQLNPKIVDKIFKLADKLEKKPDSSLKRKIMACLFYEPSTRTRFSFESAMIRLGGNVISTENAQDFSSAAKGETLEDTIRVVNNYSDIIVLRHPETGAAKRAAAVSKIPVINAGDGAGQHPTQALLDLYTIRRELGKINDIKIAFVGDLKYGRTVRSLSYLLSKYKNIEISLVSPKGLRIGKDIKDHLEKHGVRYSEHEDLNSVLDKVNVIYQTRIQKERFKSIKEYERFKDAYIIDKKVASKINPKTIIMHPLPRVNEISVEVDTLPNAAYFRQAYYGLLIRMALLKFLLYN